MAQRGYKNSKTESEYSNIPSLEEEKKLKLKGGRISKWTLQFSGAALRVNGCLRQLLQCSKQLKMVCFATLLLLLLLKMQLSINGRKERLDLESQQPVVMSATDPAESRHPESFDEMLKDRAIDNQIVLTVATSLFLNTTLNLLCSWKKIGLINYIVGALDDAVYVALKDKGVAVFPAYRQSLLGGDELKSAVTREEDFHKVNLVKEEAILWAVRAGYEVLLSDADIVWLQNPMRYLREDSQGFDYLFQSDWSGTPEEHLLNGGFLYVRPTNESQAAMSLLISTLKEDFTKNDQGGFRNLLCSGSKRTSSTTCLDPETGARTLMLPRHKYETSRTLTDAEDGDREALLKQPDLYTVHYPGGNNREKIGRMKRLGQWYLDGQGKCII